MPFLFACPACGHASQVMDRLAGTIAKCPACGIVVRIAPQGILVDAPTKRTESQPVSPETMDPVSLPQNLPVSPSQPTRSRFGLFAVFLVGVILSLPCCGATGFALYWFGMRESPASVVSIESASTGRETGDPPTKSRPIPDSDPKMESVRTRLLNSGAWLITADGRRGAIGSATIVHRELRLLIANYHVVNKFEKVAVMFPAYDGKRLLTSVQPYFESAAEKGQIARVVATDPTRDLILLQVKQLPAESRPLSLSPDSTVTGQAVRLFGAAERLNGFGQEDGILWRTLGTTVSRVIRHKHTYSNGQTAEAMIVEMTRPEDPNDVGGPVVDSQGKLLGVTTDMTAADSKDLFAIDVREIRAMLDNYFGQIGRHWIDDEEDSNAGPTIAIDEENTQPGYWINEVLRKARGEDFERARIRLIQMGAAALLELRKAARDGDPRLRAAVISILGEMRDTAAGAADDICKALDDPDLSVRVAAAEAVGKIGGAARGSMLSLVRAANDEDPKLSRLATASLRQLGPPNAADAAKLLTLWNEPNAEKRAAFLKTVQSLKPDPATATALFAPLLNDKDVKIRASVIQSLADAGPAAHAQTFAKLLLAADDPDPQLRQIALSALRKLGPAQPNEQRDLEAGLRAKFSELRLYCTEQLGKIGDKAKSSVPDIARLLRDADPRVRAAAARALAQIGNEAIQVLDDLLSIREDKEVAVRSAVIESLGIFGRQKNVLVILFNAFDDPEKPVREAAARALHSLNPPLGAQDLSQLQLTLRGKQIEARRFAAAELARLGPAAAEALPALLEAMRDPDFELRRHLIVALATHGTAAKDAIPVVADSMTAVLDAASPPAGSPDLFREAAIALGKLGEPLKALPMCMRGLKSNNPEIRKASLEWMNNAGPPARKAAKEICSLLADPQLSELAGETLLKLRGDEVVRALCDLIDDGTIMHARVAAVHVVAKMGPDAKDATQTLYQAWNRYRGKELGDAAREAMRHIQKK